MATITTLINTPIILYFQAGAGLTTFSNTKIVNNGVVLISPVVTISELSAGLYKLVYTPTVTGTYLVYASSQILGYVEVVTRLNSSYLKNIEDEALGSWSWNKVTGLLILVRQDGTSLASFNVVDDQITSSKELL